MTKLEQMQEMAREYWEREAQNTEQRYLIPDTWGIINEIITEVWNEAIKECEGRVSELERWEATDGGEAGMRAEDHGGYIDREQTLQAITPLKNRV